MKQLTLLAAAIMATCGLASAQIETGRTSVTGGRSFVVAFPQVMPESAEKPLPNPMRILIAAKDSAEVRIHSIGSVTPPFDETIVVLGGTVASVNVPVPFMSSASEVIEGLGISVTSTTPITVSTMMAWAGNGEETNHWPVAAWDTAHYVVSSFQDSYGNLVNEKLRPGQILIIAAHNNTSVSYTPTVDTEGGKDAPRTARGETRTIVLNRGETFLIRAKTDKLINKEQISDLTGTFIRSSMPVAVVSGHTKGAIMRMPPTLPPTSPFESPAHFVRNNMHEVVTPNSYAGTEFVTVPMQYTPTRVTGLQVLEFGVDDDRGDVIKIIAMSDNTVVESRTASQPFFRKVATLNRGEHYNNSVVTVPTEWRTSSPALCYQFGKSYAKLVPGLRVTEKPDETPNGHPTIEAGMPCLQSVPSVDRWVNHSIFSLAAGLDNFLRIVVDSSTLQTLVLDSRLVKDVHGNLVKPFAGSKYVTISTPIREGTHTLYSTDPNGRFCASVNGSLDGINQGRAYARVTGMDLTSACADTLRGAFLIGCGAAEGEFTLEGAPCGRLTSVNVLSSTNAYVNVSDWNALTSRRVPYTVTSIDNTRPSSAVIEAHTLSGWFVRATINIKADPTPYANTALLDFGALSNTDPFVESVTVYNASEDTIFFRPRIINEHPNTELEDASEIELPPSGITTIGIVALGRRAGLFSDTLVGVNRCGEEFFLTELRSTFSTSMVAIDNLNFDTTFGEVVERVSTLRNSGTEGVQIVGYTRSVILGDASAFTLEMPKDTPISTITWPIALPSGAMLPVHVRFDPSGQHGQFRQIHHFALSTLDTVHMLVEAFVDQGMSAQEETGIRYGTTVRLHPLPATPMSTITMSGLEPGTAQLSLFDIHGTLVARENLTVEADVVFVRAQLVNNVASGSYILRLVQNNRSATASIQVVR